jgi:hypothetical protein
MNIDKLEDWQLGRWYALYEAVNFIADECEERGKKFDAVRLEPLHIRKYVEKTSDQFTRKLQIDRDRRSVKDAVHS